MNDISAYVIPGLKSQWMPKRLIDIKPIDYVNATCEYLGVSADDLSQRGRKRKNVYARQICFFLFATNTILSLHEMIAYFGSAVSDHTTAIYGREFIRGQLSINNEKVANDLNAIMQIARNKY